MDLRADGHGSMTVELMMRKEIAEGRAPLSTQGYSIVYV